ncbi:hypothetical protein FRC10_010289 [Ceratobasidium sp. 414]|nr:hypothetical protein FRC10_010289 [Ceratobasidium sp. 414]
MPPKSNPKAKSATQRRYNPSDTSSHRSRGQISAAAATKAKARPSYAHNKGESDNEGSQVDSEKESGDEGDEEHEAKGRRGRRSTSEGGKRWGDVEDGFGDDEGVDVEPVGKDQARLPKTKRQNPPTLKEIQEMGHDELVAYTLQLHEMGRSEQKRICTLKCSQNALRKRIERSPVQKAWVTTKLAE